MSTHLDAQIVGMAQDIFRICVWLVVLAVIFVPLEWAFGILPRQGTGQSNRKSFLTDVGYYFLNNVLTGLAQIPVLVVLGWALHFLVPPQLYAFVGGLPLWARLGGGLVIGDVAYYWAHRLMHEVPFLWRFHSIHHSASRIYWLVGTRAHPLDIVFGHLCGLVPLYALGFAQPLATKPDIVAQLFVVIGMAWGFFIHANLSWRLGWAQYLVSTPAFHHWHHTKRENINRNYAALVPALDMVFGTYHLPKELPSEYGISDPMPDDLVGQLWAPFSDH